MKNRAARKELLLIGQTQSDGRPPFSPLSVRTRVKDMKSYVQTRWEKGGRTLLLGNVLTQMGGRKYQGHTQLYIEESPVLR